MGYNRKDRIDKNRKRANIHFVPLHIIVKTDSKDESCLSRKAGS